jgi:hypothetical protein
MVFVTIFEKSKKEFLQLNTKTCLLVELEIIPRRIFLNVGLSVGKFFYCMSNSLVQAVYICSIYWI